MLRHEWEFEFTASKLADAAESKKEMHQERLAFWEKTKAELMARAKDTGIEIVESAAAVYSNKSSGFGPQVQINPEIQLHFSECHMKLKEHAEKIREYDGWVQVLRANPEVRLKLHSEDWLFFFGANK